jgi:tetratricopeptide (TPR) repeat protein
MHIFLLLLQVSIATPNSLDQLWIQGREQLNMGKYADADRTLRAALHGAESPGGNRTALGVILNDLAEVCRRLGNYSEAESLYSRAIAILRSEAAFRELAMVLGNQGTMYREIGQPLRSAASFEESLLVAKKAHLEKEPLVGAILNGLAAAGISAKGNLKKAQQLLEQSLRIRERTLGPDHLDVSETLNNLGTVLYQRKEYTKAEAALQRALFITRKHLGSDHPDVAVTLSNLGILYYDRHEYEAAENALREALEIREKRLPPDHPSIALSLLHLARVMMNLSRSTEAQELLQRAVAIRNQRPSAVDPETLLTLEQYARALRLNGYGSDAAAIEARARWMRAELKYVVKAYR